MPESEDFPQPGWEDQELLATAWENVGVGTDEGLPDEVRFVTNVARLVRVRLAEAPGEDTVPCVFFLLPQGPEDVDLEAEPLLHTGLVPVGRRFWFVSPVVTNAGRLELHEWNDADAFELAARLGAAEAPAVLFDPRPSTPLLFYYSQGLKRPDEVKRLRLDASEVSLADVLQVVDQVHEKFLQTPGAQDPVGKVWQNRALYRPVAKAEAVIQMHLRIGLQLAFASCVVRREQHGVAGRLDLEVEEPIPGHEGGLVPKAILELKVLRSFGSKGAPVADTTNKDAVEEGVRQAAAYRRERKAREAALCCFDMRTKRSGETCFVHVRPLAKRNGIVLRVWHLFNSATAYRNATIV